MAQPPYLTDDEIAEICNPLVRALFGEPQNTERNQALTAEAL